MNHKKIILLSALLISGCYESAPLTETQANAVKSAKLYLGQQGISRAGLIYQLSSELGEGFTLSDATTAVDSLNVNWNRQAAESAREYSSLGHFSCSKLIEKLTAYPAEGFTLSEATYGAKRAGVCR